MLQDIEARNHVEGCGWKTGLVDLSNKDVGAGFPLRFFRGFSGHFNSIELPVGCGERLQEGTRAAAEVKDRAGLLVWRQRRLAVHPAYRRILARGRYAAIIGLGVVLVHVFLPWRIAEPYQRAGRAAQERVLLVPAVKAVGGSQPQLPA